MSDERDKEGQAKGFTVSDRRKRYEEAATGTPEPSAAPQPKAESPAAKPEAAQPAPVGAAAEPTAAEGPAPELGDAAHGPVGPADFLQLIAKLYQDGLAFMGLFDDPQAGQSMANFPIASWHIDILGVLAEKTKGNLTEEEGKLLGDAIANLKLTFVRASGLIKH